MTWKTTASALAWLLLVNLPPIAASTPSKASDPPVGDFRPGGSWGLSTLLGEDERGRHLSVETLVAGGPAARHGLQIGDHIVSLDGTPIAFRSNLEKMESMALGYEPGQLVVLGIRRGQEHFDLSLRLGPPVSGATAEALEEWILQARHCEDDSQRFRDFLEDLHRQEVELLLIREIDGSARVEPADLTFLLDAMKLDDVPAGLPSEDPGTRVKIRMWHEDGKVQIRREVQD